MLGGWRIAGVHAYASGYPLTVFPGYGLPLNGGDNRITVLDYEGWRAPTQGDAFDPLVDLWWDPAAFNRTPVDSVDQLAGLQGRRAAGRLRQRHGAQPERARAVVPQREHLAGAHLRHRRRPRFEFRLEVFNLFNRTIWGAPESTITSANFGKVTTLANAPRQIQLGFRYEF